MRFEYYADSLGLLRLIRPDAPDFIHLPSNPPPRPLRYEHLMRELAAQREQEYAREIAEWLSEDEATRGAEPARPAIVTFRDVHDMQQKDWVAENTNWLTGVSRYNALFNWVNSSVDSDILSTVQSSLRRQGKLSL